MSIGGVVMHIRLRLFRSKPEKDGNSGTRYVSCLQRDIRKYEGWTKEAVDADYRASKSVHTILTIGYMEYANGILVLTDRGEVLMKSIEDIPTPAD